MSLVRLEKMPDLYEGRLLLYLGVDAPQNAYVSESYDADVPTVTISWSNEETGVVTTFTFVNGNQRVYCVVKGSERLFSMNFTSPCVGEQFSEIPITCVVLDPGIVSGTCKGRAAYNLTNTGLSYVEKPCNGGRSYETGVLKPCVMSQIASVSELLLFSSSYVSPTQVCAVD